MSDRFAFNRGAVKPLQALSQGWQLIKDEYWLFLGMAFVAQLLAGAPFGILYGPAMCGLHLCLSLRARGEPASFNVLFKGFDYFMQSFIATLLMLAASFLFVMPLMVLYFVAFFAIMAQAPRQGPPNEEFFLSFIALYAIFIPALLVISMAIHGLFLFTFPLIVDRELTGVEAVKLSVRAFFGNFLGMAGLMVLWLLLTLAGALACYVGVLFILPVAYAMVEAAYRQVFPPIDTIGRRLRAFEEEEDDDLPASRSSSTAIEPE